MILSSGEANLGVYAPSSTSLVSTLTSNQPGGNNLDDQPKLAGSQETIERKEHSLGTKHKRVRDILEEAMDEAKEKSLEKVMREKKVREKPLNKVEEEIQQLKKQLYDIQVAGLLKNLIYLNEIESLFTKEIIQALLPPKFSIPQSNTYDESGDSIEHLESYCNLMVLHGATSLTIYKDFSLILCRSARQWAHKYANTKLLVNARRNELSIVVEKRKKAPDENKNELGAIGHKRVLKGASNDRLR
ncbi:hypothetical protein FNV43_RR24533 [Rhamnella rubrinervis]|uniref:Uncharacterized protein n=1 Tax=Rhamnella rubrinervis TaxID=2594499 RepID=A0A8K0DMY7_9ROSA|nr:hypothetical protein FNV43_RR24533 [Rhamnella rubrinervis]